MIEKFKNVIKSYDKWRWMQIAVSLWLFEVAFAFLLSAISHPVMTEDVYGSVIYYIPAEVWSLWIMLASALQFWGVVKNIKYMAIRKSVV